MNNEKTITIILSIVLILTIPYYFLFKEIPILVFPDSAGYTSLIGKSMFTRGFYHALFHGRPLTVPLLYWFLKTNENIILFQKAFYFLSCTIIAMSIGFALRGRFLRVVSSLIIFFSLFDRDYLFWNHAILSESISICLILLFLSFLIVTYTYNIHNKIFWLSGMMLTFFVVAARDVHAYLAFALAISYPFLLCKQFGIKKGLICSIVVCSFLVSIGLFQNYNAQVNGRYLFSLVNVINKRILSHQERIDYFREYGFPYNKSVLSLRGKWASECHWQALEPWLSNRGKSVYTKFLLENYTYTLHEVYNHIDILINTTLFKRYTHKFSQAESEYLKMYYLSFFRIDFNILMMDFFIMSLILLLKRDNKAYLPIVIMFLGVSQMIICFHGDAMEFERHCLMSSLIIKTGFLFSLFIFMEKIGITVTRSDTSLFRLQIRYVE